MLIEMDKFVTFRLDKFSLTCYNNKAIEMMVKAHGCCRLFCPALLTEFWTVFVSFRERIKWSTRLSTKWKILFLVFKDSLDSPNGKLLVTKDKGKYYTIDGSKSMKARRRGSPWSEGRIGCQSSSWAASFVVENRLNKTVFPSQHRVSLSVDLLEDAPSTMQEEEKRSLVSGLIDKLQYPASSLKQPYQIGMAN